MHKTKRRLVSLLIVLAMLFSMMGTAAAETTEADESPTTATEVDSSEKGEQTDEAAQGVYTEEPPPTEETDEDLSEAEVSDEYIAPGVWSDEDPYFTDEVPELSSSSGGGRRKVAAARDVTYPTYEQAYRTMMALQSEFPEGLKWTNFEPYGSKSDVEANKKGYRLISGNVKGAQLGVGCAAFCFILSDKTFGNLPLRVVDEGGFKFEDIRVGDFLRVRGSHFVTVIRITSSGVVVAEGNYNGTVHWGRAISKEEVMFTTNFLVSRYPADYSENEVAVTKISSGKEGDLDWEISSKRVLTITGSGAMQDYDYQTRPSWEKVTDSGGKAIPFYGVEIGSGITSIGAYAFDKQTELVSASLPDTITTISNSAFRESGLVGISIPGNVKTISDDAFRGCANLTSVDIADGVEVIGERAFYGCTHLTAADFPSSLTKLGAGAFTSCDGLLQVRFMPSKGKLEIGANAFTQCYHLNFVSLPEGITSLSSELFFTCTHVTYVYIPSTVMALAGGLNSPFQKTTVDTIYFGGTQAQWDGLMSDLSKLSSFKETYDMLLKAHVEVDQVDPFVPLPDDPGDIEFLCAKGHTGVDDGNGNCTVCGDPIDSSTNPPVNPGGDDDKPVNPPATHQHKWAGGWSHDETHHWHECTNSGCTATSNSSKGSYGVHNYGDWVIDKEATASQAGSQYKDCSVCAYRVTETIPAVGGSTEEPVNSGNTGGSSGSGDSGNNKPSGGTGSSGSSRPGGGSSSSGGATKPSTTTKPSEPDKPANVDVTQNPNGTTTTTVKLTEAEVHEVAQSGKPIPLPITSVTAARDIAMASAIIVQTGTNNLTKVAIPVTKPTAGAVAVIVKADGSTEVVKDSAVTSDSLIAKVTDGTTLKIVDNSKVFADVATSSWAKNAIDFASARELFAGTSTTTFSPDAPMTRAMLVTVLARFDGAETTGGESWYAKSIEWAKRNGVSDGSNPAGNITREQLVTMLWRYYGMPSANDALPEYTDTAQISGYAEEAMRWAMANGIVGGFGDGRLGPQGQATRAQVAQMLMNLLNNTSLSPAR